MELLVVGLAVCVIALKWQMWGLHQRVRALEESEKPSHLSGRLDAQD